MHAQQKAGGSTPLPNSDQRFRRHSRLLEKPHYQRVFQGARRSRDRFFTVLYRANEQGGPRLGLAISKKHCRLATGRNRLKRVVRESFRHVQQSLPGVDIVVLNQSAAATANNKTLFDSLASHWQRCSKDLQKRAGTDIDG